jgi:polyisoprenoid-binding protein YceI
MGLKAVRSVVAIAAAMLLTLPATAAPSQWAIDSQHASAQFAVKHLMISTVRGEFHGLTGTITWDDKDITKSTVEVSIDTTTVDTREPKRDAHLKSPDFFDVAKFPTITFKSKKIDQAGAGKLKVIGDLTIRGVTKEVTLDVEGPTAPIKDPWGNTRVALNATATVNRQDFGVKWNANVDGGGVVVGDNVNITIDAEFVKKQ